MREKGKKGRMGRVFIREGGKKTRPKRKRRDERLLKALFNFQQRGKDVCAPDKVGGGEELGFGQGVRLGPSQLGD